MTWIIWLRDKIIQFLFLMEEIIYPSGSLKTAINNTIKYLQRHPRIRSKNLRTFDQLIKFKEGRQSFIQFYSICFTRNKGKVFDTTPVVKAMEAIKTNMECCEEITFIKYPDSINSIDDLILHLKVVRDCPDILVMEM